MNLKDYDVFGTPLEFNINGQGGVNTRLGGCISIGIQLTIMIIAILTYVNYYKDPSPSIVYERSNLDADSKSEYSTEKLKFFYLMSELLRNPSNPSQKPDSLTLEALNLNKVPMYLHKLTSTVTSNPKAGKLNNIEMGKNSFKNFLNEKDTENQVKHTKIGDISECALTATGMTAAQFTKAIKDPAELEKIKKKFDSSSDVLRKMASFFSIEQLANIMCLAFDKGNLSIGSDKRSKGTEFISSGTTAMPICQVFRDKSCNANNYQKFIDDALQVIVMVYNTKQVNLGNRSEPLKEVELATKEVLLDLNKDLNFMIKIKKNTIRTNPNLYASFILEQVWPYEEETFTTFSTETRQVPRKKSNIDPVTKQPILSINIYFERDREEVTITRQYKKCDELLATILAVWDLLVMIFAFFFKFYNYKRYEYYLLNKLYFCTDELKDDSKTSNDIKKNIQNVRENSSKGKFII